jgi:D-glycero-D-manno-heptose 1,7-bisphosphate phosphatase
MRRRAIFIDRDGTLCEEVGYVNHVSRCRLMPNSLEAVRLANRASFLVIVATNQAGVARGYFEEPLIGEVHDRIRAWIEKGGARIDAFYYCPHHPSEGQPPYREDCDCRKPRPGMLLRAAREHDIDLQRSYMIGDSLADLGAAAGSGAVPIHVLTGYGRGLAEHHAGRFTIRPQFTAGDLLGAVRWILARESPSIQSPPEEKPS